MIQEHDHPTRPIIRKRIRKAGRQESRKDFTFTRDANPTRSRAEERNMDAKGHQETIGVTFSKNVTPIDFSGKFSFVLQIPAHRERHQLPSHRTPQGLELQTHPVLRCTDCQLRGNHLSQGNPWQGNALHLLPFTGKGDQTHPRGGGPSALPPGPALRIRQPARPHPTRILRKLRSREKARGHRHHRQG